MTKKVDKTLKKTGIEKEKTSLKISRKNNSKPTKKVILETPILEQIPEKKSKRTISRKKPVQKEAIGSLNVAPKSTIASQNNSSKSIEDLDKEKTISLNTENISKQTILVSTSDQKENQNLMSKEIVEDIDIEDINIEDIEFVEDLQPSPSNTEIIPENKIIDKLENNNINIQKRKSEKISKTKGKKSNTTLTPNTPMPNSKKNSCVLDNKQILVKPKRTLKLNLEKKAKTIAVEETQNSIVGFSDIPIVEASPIPKKNVSINQNSSFFYEPSIFEKFNITVSNIDEESSEQANTEISDNNIAEFSSNTEPIIENKEAEKTKNAQPIVESITQESNKEIIIDDASVAYEQTVSEENNISQVEQLISPSLEVTDSSNLDNQITSTNENQEIEDVEDELINALLDEIIEEELSEKPSEPESFDFVSNEVPEELKEAFEKNLELSAKKQKFIEDASNEYDFISTETPDIYKPYFSTDALDSLEETNSENDNLEVLNSFEAKILDENNSETIEAENLAEDNSDITDTTFDEVANNINIINEDIDTSNTETENLLEVNFAKNEVELVETKEAADNLITDEILKGTQEKADDTAIGKFFDSSIPSMSQEADASYFTKIKKSLFSNISTVFKKFSYEEATLLNSEKETFEEASPIIELNKPTSTDEIKQVLENFDNKETSINNLEVSASQNTLVLPNIDEKVLEAKEISPNTTDEAFTNIVTPPSVPIDDISLDDIDLKDIDITDLELSDIEDILDETNEVDNTENNEISEKTDISDIGETESQNEEQTLDIVEDLNNDESIETESSEEFEELDETLEDDFYSQFSKQNDELANKLIDETDEEFDNLSEEDIDEELNELLGIEPEDSQEDDEQFSIEEYFGVTPKEPENDEDDDFAEELEEEFETEKVAQEDIENELPNMYQEQINSFSKLIENFTQTISNLSNKITELENNISTNDTASISEKNEIENSNTVLENNEQTTINETISENELQNDSTTNADNITDNINDNIAINEEKISESLTNNDDNLEQNIQDINLEDISIDDISLDDISLEDLEALEKTTDIEEPSLLPIQDETEVENKEIENTNSVEDILLKAFDNPEINDQMKNDLLSEVLSVEDELPTSSENSSNISTPVETETTSDFFKIIDSLSKTISELEKAPDFVEETKENKNDVTALEPEEKVDVLDNPTVDEKEPEVIQNFPTVSEEKAASTEEVAFVPENTSDKAINILINKDDIFSIAILNETYEIVTDFDGISVISENIHISTPKNNFYVNIGEKYIEIHKQPDLFVVNTNFEDIEFANAINNVTFAKKKNKIELNIKAAFKLSSINKKIELSMLNTSIANLNSTQEKSDDNSSICDNKTLVINEETQKVYLPYTIEEVMKKLNNSSDYQSLEDVIEQEYTLPLSTFKMPIISRFKEAYRFMRTKEKSSIYAALDLAVELMFNSNLNPAVIRASKDLKELNIYLDCLYENELEKFDCFKVIYKVLPKIQ